MVIRFVLGVVFGAMAASVQAAEVPASYLEADKILNDTYKEMMAALSVEARDGLKAAQRAWVPYRDLSAELERRMGADAGDGTAAYHACMRG